MSEVKTVSKALEKAKSELVPLDFLRINSSVDLKANVDPLGDDIQYYRFEQCTDFEQHEAENGMYLVEYVVELGLAAADKALQFDDENFQFSVQVMSTYKALYRTEEELSRESLEAFCEKHVIFHVWPFWREFVVASCHSAGMEKPLPVPLKVISEKKTRRANKE